MQKNETMIYNLLQDFKQDFQEFKKDIIRRFDQVDQRLDRMDNRMDISDGRLQNLEKDVRQIYKNHEKISVRFTTSWATASVIIALGSGILSAMLVSLF